ncbi:hypothetical protein VTH06DRAFT_1113, partial [Thermothelomyces fergusii]
KDGDGDDGEDGTPWDTFALSSLGLLTRAVGFRSRLGAFRWRYAGRRERRALAREGPPAAPAADDDDNDVLVLERAVRVAVRHGRGRGRREGVEGEEEGEEEVWTVVARFVRPRGAGAGAGGRLLVDLGAWEDAETEAKDARAMALVMVVATCLVMLKREIDRRRAQQIAIMAGAAGGGGS